MGNKNWRDSVFLVFFLYTYLIFPFNFVTRIVQVSQLLALIQFSSAT